MVIQRGRIECVHGNDDDELIIDLYCNACVVLMTRWTGKLTTFFFLANEPKICFIAQLFGSLSDFFSGMLSMSATTQRAPNTAKGIFRKIGAESLLDKLALIAKHGPATKGAINLARHPIELLYAITLPQVPIGAALLSRITEAVKVNVPLMALNRQ